jgi:hypothetical protein
MVRRKMGLAICFVDIGDLVLDIVDRGYCFDGCFFTKQYPGDGWRAAIARRMAESGKGVRYGIKDYSFICK